MGFRCKELFGTTSVACFCPFGKDIGTIINWFPEDAKRTYSNFFEVKFQKSRFDSYAALLAHCDGKKVWYHDVYAVFLRGFYCLPAKPSRKRKNLVPYNYDTR